MKIFLITLLLFITIFLIGFPVISNDMSEFKLKMTDWENKIELAKEYLSQAEYELKNGNKKQGCVFQKRAGEMGVKGTESLIKAFEINGNTKGEISNLKIGLNRWKELRDFC